MILSTPLISPPGSMQTGRQVGELDGSLIHDFVLWFINASLGTWCCQHHAGFNWHQKVQKYVCVGSVCVCGGVVLPVVLVMIREQGVEVNQMQ